MPRHLNPDTNDSPCVFLTQNMPSSVPTRGSMVLRASGATLVGNIGYKFEGTLGHFEQQLNSFEDLILQPSALAYENLSTVDYAISRLLNEGMKLFEDNQLEAGQILAVADVGVAVIERYFRENDGNGKIRQPGDEKEFISTATHLEHTFYTLSAEIPPTRAQDIRRAKVLLRIDGRYKPEVVGDLLAKYEKQLLSDEPGSDDFEELWQNPDFIAAIGESSIWNANKHGAIEDWPPAVVSLLKKAINKLGFDDEESTELFRAWQSYDDQSPKENSLVHVDRIKASIDVLSSLRCYGKEVPHEVYRVFGIRNFHRYNGNHLSDQLRHYQAVKAGVVQKQPRALVIGATDDGNYALAHPMRRFGKIHPIYMEAGSLGDVARRLARMKQIGPISTLIVHAHGYPDRVTFSEGNYVTTQDMKRSIGLKRIRSKGMLRQDAEILLVSCSTGVKKGIAQSISRSSGLAVSAPDFPTNLDLRQRSDGEIYTFLDVDHQDSGNSSKFRRKIEGKLIRYVAGQKQ